MLCVSSLVSVQIPSIQTDMAGYVCMYVIVICYVSVAQFQSRFFQFRHFQFTFFICQKRSLFSYCQGQFQVIIFILYVGMNGLPNMANPSPFSLGDFNSDWRITNSFSHAVWCFLFYQKMYTLFKKNAILCLFFKKVSTSKRVVYFIPNNFHFLLVEGIAFYAL